MVEITALLPAMKDHGISGILRGATDSFFGFLGFDAVCALATETKDQRNDGPMSGV